MKDWNNNEGKEQELRNGNIKKGIEELRTWEDLENEEQTKASDNEKQWKKREMKDTGQNMIIKNMEGIGE